MTALAPVTVDTPAADVLASGAVLWRPATGGPELAVVHRPRYDDWSFPKGKLDNGETMPFAAVREVTEETGFTARLDATIGDIRYPVPEGRKVVRYWSAQALDGAFTPTDEVDELRWLPRERVEEMLSYRHDLEVLHRFAMLGTPTSVVALVRHAKAGSRQQWDGSDAQRPLSGAGRAQAQQLTRLLRLFGPERVASAPLVRCRDTVAPLAAELGGVPITEEPLLAEDTYWDDPAAGRRRMRELVAQRGVAVVCSQGGVIPDLVGAFGEGAGLPHLDPDDVPSRKASTWLLTFAEDRVRSADYYPHPTG